MSLGKFARRITAASILCFALFATASWAIPGYFVIRHRDNFASLPGRHVLVDWSAFGAAGDIIPSGTGHDFPTGAGSEGVSVGSSFGSLAIHQEGVDFTGDFAPGEFLLTDGGSQSSTFTIHLGPGVLGVGFQIEPHYIDGPWTGTIELDVHGGLTYSVSGVAGVLEDGSAPFFGFVNNRPGVNTIKLTINQTGPGLPGHSGAVAINMLDIIVPEPPSALLLASALLALAGMAIRRSRG